MKPFPSCRFPTVGLLATLLLAPSLAHAWWNGDWTGRKPVRIDTSATGAAIAEPIGATAVLVRLHAGNFRFDAAREDGSDLRFVAADDKTPLKFHLERYDALLGEGLAWVAIPELKPGAKTEIWLYYGNAKAPAAEDSKGTYDPGTALVYHFAERGQPPRDSSSWGIQATEAGASADGTIIGRGLRLDGTSSITIPSAPSLAWPAGARMTWSAWIKPADADASGVVFSRREGARAVVIGLEGGKPFVELGSDAGVQRAAAAASLPPATWHHLAVTAGDEIKLYVDGAAVAKMAGVLPVLEGPSRIGADAGAPAVAPAAPPVRRGGKGPAPAPIALGGFKGDLDELQIAKLERSAGYLQAAAISQGTDPGRFIAYGQDEEKGGWDTGYLAILVRSVTLDGWIVIGLLGVMAVVSWIVIATKAAYLSAAEKANERFAECFQHMSDDLVQAIAEEAGHFQAEDKLFRSSPLYRIYQIGAEGIRKRTRTGRALTAEAIEAVRASLDAGLVREHQKLTSRMVLLTIAISGGPFLGLLGTVVGVMITFASIALAGDVNVNAIAPGIAAALVATVAGLAVAIPALFAYNWLLTRVKDVYATMQVFVDEFITKAAESYADGNGSHGVRPRPTIVAAE